MICRLCTAPVVWAMNAKGVRVAFDAALVNHGARFVFATDKGERKAYVTVIGPGHAKHECGRDEGDAGQGDLF